MNEGLLYQFSLLVLPLAERLVLRVAQRGVLSKGSFEAVGLVADGADVILRLQEILHQNQATHLEQR